MTRRIVPSVALVPLAVALVLAGPGLASLATAQSRPAIPLLRGEEVARLEAGEILTELVPGDVIEVRVVGLVDGRPLRVAHLLEEFARLRLLVPSISASAVVGEEGEFRLHRATLETPWPMDARLFTFRTWRGEVEIDGLQAWMSAFDYVPGSGNLADGYGQLLLIPWDGEQTLVLLDVSVDLGTWLPGAVERWAVTELLPSVIEGLRGQLARQREVASRWAWRDLTRWGSPRCRRPRRRRRP